MTNEGNTKKKQKNIHQSWPFETLVKYRFRLWTLELETMFLRGESFVA